MCFLTELRHPSSAALRCQRSSLVPGPPDRGWDHATGSPILQLADADVGTP